MNTQSIGITLLIVGALFLVAGKHLGLGHLPGDFRFQWGNVTLVLPFGTCLLASIILSVVLKLVGK